MPGIVRVGMDTCSGHDGFNPRPPIAGSPTVFCNGLPVVRVGDLWSLHSNIRTVHDGAASAGSGTVFCDGLPVVRQLDPLTCGSTAITGSLDTFCG